MAIPGFYHPDLDVSDQTLELSDQERQHANSVRRLKEGAAVKVLNGRGLIAKGTILTLSKKNFTVSIDQTRDYDQLDSGLILAVAVPRVDRQRWMVEALTQLGVTQIQPLVFSCSSGHSSHKIESKWPRYAIEAIKQSHNPWLPEIQPLQDLSAWLDALIDDGQRRYLADREGQVGRLRGSSSQSAIVVVGPEGGVTNQERESMLAKQFELLTLGTHVLRLEIAAISVAAICGGIIN